MSFTDFDAKVHEEDKYLIFSSWFFLDCMFKFREITFKNQDDMARLFKINCKKNP